MATAAREQIVPEPLDDRQAVAAAIAAGGDLENRILARAAALPGAAALFGAVRQVVGTLRVAMGLLAVLGLVLGGAAAAAALAGEPGRPLNVYAMIGGVLGVQMVLLLAWAVITIVRPSALHHLSLAGIAWAATRWIVRRAGGGTVAAAAVAGIAGTHGRGAAARWSFGTVSNGIWTAFNIGCLVTTVALLSVRQRSFCWESTILAGDAYASVTDAIAWLPRE
ncbi:MAG: DUF2868 domain-containing protein, partial [Phycisphaerales bacterium]|nr:DUF2868 domain-containing protein [Phycisphaerales bacterium]